MTTQTEQIAHNLTVSSAYVEEENRWMHHLVVVISDVDKTTEKIEHSEQFNMTMLPVMRPLELVRGLRDLAAKIEEHAHV